MEKLVKRTESFDGANFQDWKFRVGANLHAVVPESAKLLKWAEDETDPPDAQSWQEAGSPPRDDRPAPSGAAPYRV